MRPNWVTPWFLQTSPSFSFLSFSSSPPAVYWNPTHNSRTTFIAHITEAWRWSSPILIPFLLLTAYLYWNFWSILSGFPYKIFSWPSIMWVLQLSLFYRWRNWGLKCKVIVQGRSICPPQFNGTKLIIGRAGISFQLFSSLPFLRKNLKGYMFWKKTHSQSLLGTLNGNVLHFQITSDYILFCCFHFGVTWDL